MGEFRYSRCSTLQKCEGSEQGGRSFCWPFVFTTVEFLFPEFQSGVFTVDKNRTWKMISCITDYAFVLIVACLELPDIVVKDFY